MAMNQSEHYQLIDQVISLENDFEGQTCGLTSEHTVAANNNNVSIVEPTSVSQSMALTNNGLEVLNEGYIDATEPMGQQQIGQMNCVVQGCVDTYCGSQMVLSDGSCSTGEIVGPLFDFDKQASRGLSMVEPLGPIGVQEEEEEVRIETIRKELVECEPGQQQAAQLQVHYEEQPSRQYSMQTNALHPAHRLVHSFNPPTQLSATNDTHLQQHHHQYQHQHQTVSVSPTTMTISPTNLMSSHQLHSHHPDHAHKHQHRQPQQQQHFVGPVRSNANQLHTTTHPYLTSTHITYVPVSSPLAPAAPSPNQTIYGPQNVWLTHHAHPQQQQQQQHHHHHLHQQQQQQHQQQHQQHQLQLQLQPQTQAQQLHQQAQLQTGNTITLGLNSSPESSATRGAWQTTASLPQQTAAYSTRIGQISAATHHLSSGQTQTQTHLIDHTQPHHQHTHPHPHSHSHSHSHTHPHTHHAHAHAQLQHPHPHQHQHHAHPHPHAHPQPQPQPHSHHHHHHQQVVVRQANYIQIQQQPQLVARAPMLQPLQQAQPQPQSHLLQNHHHLQNHTNEATQLQQHTQALVSSQTVQPKRTISRTISPLVQTSLPISLPAGSQGSLLSAGPEASPVAAGMQPAPMAQAKSSVASGSPATSIQSVPNARSLHLDENGALLDPQTVALSQTNRRQFSSIENNGQSQMATSKSEYLEMCSTGSSLSQDWLDKICHQLVEHMNHFGICVIDNFLGSLKADLILKEVQRLYSSGHHTKGRLVSNKFDPRPSPMGASDSTATAPSTPSSVATSSSVPTGQDSPSITPTGGSSLLQQPSPDAAGSMVATLQPVDPNSSSAANRPTSTTSSASPPAPSGTHLGLEHGQLATTNGQQRKQVSLAAIRSDRVIWVDGCEEGCTEINNLIQTLCSVITNSSRLSLCSNNELSKHLINKRTRAHVACYPGHGTGYIKHVDNPNGDGRLITAIYYLNKNWNTKRDGGLLRMFPAGMDEVANIEPLFDRVLFFWSDRRNPHEVLPAYRDRFAITVWYIGETRQIEHP